MLCQKNLNKLQISYLNLKKMRFSYFVPIIILFAFLPFMSIGYVIADGMVESTYIQTFIDFQRFIPFFCTWWIMFSLNEYVEGKGRELLYIYKKSLLSDYLLLFFWYMLHVVVLLMGYHIFMNSFWMDLILLLIQSCFLSALSFFLMICFRTISVSFLIVLFYEIFCIFSNYGILKWINIFSIRRIENISQLFPHYILILIFSVIMIIMGNILYKRMTTAYK